MFDRAQIDHLKKEAEKMQVEPAMLLAVIEKESAGQLFWRVHGKQVPAIRFEGHYFYRKLRNKPDKLKEAVEEGLAHPNAGRVKNPRSYAARYRLLHRAMEIDPGAAIESTSWGLGQVMGSHWRALGYRSAADLQSVAANGFYGQVDLMVRFIKRFQLVDDLQNKNFKGFARGYNGPGYRRNKYDTHLRSLYRRWVKRLGGKNIPLTSDLPGLLNAAGYPVSRYGSMRLAVQAFQGAHDLVVDGIAGPMTLKTLEEVKAGRFKKKIRQAAIGGASAAPGLGVGIGKISEILYAVDDASSAGDTARNVLEMFGVPQWFVLTVMALIVGAVLYFAIQAVFRDEDEEQYI